MAEQLDLAASADAPVEQAAPITDERLTAAALEYPDAKLILFHNTATGASFVMQVPPSSPWHELLPAQQETFIRSRTPE